MTCEDKDELAAPAECLRCGTCCRQGGPALHSEDLQLIKKGALSFTQLVTIRCNEPAHNPIQDKVLPSSSEFIKIKGQSNSWSCRFFDQVNNGCLIYRTRPLECRLLFCRDTEPLTAIIGRDLLSRHKLLPENDPVLPLIDRLEVECSYRLVNNLLSGADNSRDDIKERLNDLVRKDLTIRDGFLRNFENRREEELFLFGRPLFLVLASYGFRLVEKDGAITLEQTSP
ncbi:MAG: YkgJ family cysteine cluster protein [Desulfobulbaceae bacterium]|nr:YkgJ family cysteine cluster protein [Desulfobulbaceae bacterium]